MIRGPSRPAGITILAIFEILFGIVGLIASLAIIGFSVLFSSLPRVGFLQGTFGLIVGGIVLFFSFIWLATGVGFLHGRGWSWTLGMFFSVLSLLGAVAALTISLITGGIGGIFFWGLMLYYLTRTRVKAFFGKAGLLINPAQAIPYSLVPQVNQPQVATGNSIYGPSVTFPPVSQGSSMNVPVTSAAPTTTASPSSSMGGKAPVCPYCHNTLPMGTTKCLTCGAAL